MAYERSIPDDPAEDKNVFQTACAYLSAGLSLIPIKPDGSKAPFSALLPWDDLLQKHVWKPYQAQLPSHQELINWFALPTGAGVGIVGGSISGNLEIIDFDQLDLYDLWCALVNDVAPGLLAKLTLLVGTPKPGRHVPYRCARIEGNQKLAWDDDGKATLIETRGDGGYVVAPGSPLACHPSRRPYEVLKGSWETIPTMTPEERDILLGLARSFNRHQPDTDEKPPSYPSNGHTSGDRPGDEFNARAGWDEVLTPSGWTVAGQCGQATLWKRPGKTTPGHSAITGNGDDRLCVFSSNTAPLEPYGDRKKTYSKFQAYATLAHGGDFAAAAKALAAMGYGRNGQPADEPHISSISDEPQKPTIQISTDMPVVVDALEHALRTMPKAPQVFQRERKLSVITHEVKPPEWLHRPMDAPAICPIEAPYLRELASKAAQWERWDDRKKDGQKWVKTLPPEWAIHSLMARPYSRFPVLEGLIFAPTIRPDGSILETPGYDVKTGLYACFKPNAFPPIPQRPTADDARAAIEALKDPFVDFIFAKPCHQVAAISAICTIVCRFAINGPVPLFGVSATAPGSGKGLAIDAITTSAIGRTAPRWAQTADHEEERKRLFAIAVEGDPVVHIDNVIHPLGSAALDMVMTAQVVKERKMKTLTNETARIYAVLFASGNNLTYKQTLSRRVVPIDLDPGVERPEERAEFTYNPLLPYVYQRWRTLAVHALTIIRAFYVAKQPKQHLTAFGSFESWSTIIREALVWAGEVDSCEGRKDMRAESDLDLEALQTLMACWYTCYEDKSVDTKKVAQDLKLYTANDGVVKWCDLQDAIRTFSLRNPDRQLTSLQIAVVLRTYKGRIVQGRRFIRVGGNETNAGEWKLETCTSA